MVRMNDRARQTDTSKTIGDICIKSFFHPCSRLEKHQFGHFKTKQVFFPLSNQSWCIPPIDICTAHGLWNLGRALRPFKSCAQDQVNSGGLELSLSQHAGTHMAACWLTAPDLPCLLLIGNYRPAWTLCPRPAPHRMGPRYCRGESARRTGVPLRDTELLLPPCCRCAPRPRFSFAAASLAPTTKSLGLVWLLLTRGFAVATLTGFAPLPQTNRPAGCCYFEAVLHWVLFLSLLFP